MDYMARIEALKAKQGLTEAEQAEVRLYYSMALKALRAMAKRV